MKRTVTVLPAVATRGLAVAVAALSLAGGHVPDWTDYNESDPGVTLLGLRAGAPALVSTDLRARPSR